jgi:hypothetical protein
LLLESDNFIVVWNTSLPYWNTCKILICLWLIPYHL